VGYFLRFRLGICCRSACCQHAEGSYRASQLRTADEEIISEQKPALFLLKHRYKTRFTVAWFCQIGIVMVLEYTFSNRLSGMLFSCTPGDRVWTHP